MSEPLVHGAFSSEQKEYLSGFLEAVAARIRSGDGTPGSVAVPPAGSGATIPAPDAAPTSVYGTPIESLTKEERWKLERDALALWERMRELAEAGKFPEGPEVFLMKYHGLFYVAPAQDSFMLRCRIPGGRLLSHQLRGLGRMARECGGGYADATTRANFQIREIPPAKTVDALIALRDLGLTSRGAGADNIRNITASPTAGIDPIELIDVLPLAHRLHHEILGRPDMYGLPRKFNIAFDGGGEIGVAADTNDIGFFASRLGEEAAARIGVAPGLYFRIRLAGITGHKQLALETGRAVSPEHCVDAALAIVRVFIENADRTNRRKARLKYLIDRWGVEKFVEEVAARCRFPLPKIAPEVFDPRPEVVRHAHVGIRPQKQAGRSYAGVVLPVGRISSDRMEALADISEEFGAGEVRLTVFQNLIVPHVPNERVPDLVAAIRAIGLDVEAPPVVAGLVACTGNAGCKYAAANTKRHAMELGDRLRASVAMDSPINIHLTGCPHSCAQHYVGDIGLLGMKVGEEAVEGYNVAVGGGMDHEQGIARELVANVPYPEVGPLIERLLEAYLAKRSEGETFLGFARRHEIAELKEMAGANR